LGARKSHIIEVEVQSISHATPALTQNCHLCHCATVLAFQLLDTCVHHYLAVLLGTLTLDWAVVTSGTVRRHMGDRMPPRTSNLWICIHMPQHNPTKHMWHSYVADTDHWACMQVYHWVCDAESMVSFTTTDHHPTTSHCLVTCARLNEQHAPFFRVTWVSHHQKG